MNVNIWGCRGSIARSHPSLQRYGGNTPCVEVFVESDSDDGSENEDQKKETRIVLDMGSGAYDLGQKLVKMGPLKDQNILLTHCHWDHIQGFPFFSPLFIPGSCWSVHAPGGFTTSLKEKLSSQMSYEFFPLSIDMLGATIDYYDLTEGQLKLGNVLVTSQYLNHPVLTLGYRFEAPDGTSMAYITDHEPFNRAFAVDGYTRNHSVNPNDGSNTTPDNGDDRHVDFLKDVDLLIHDAQYTAEEYKGKVGWGHGTIEYVTDIAMAAGVKTLALFHHDPQRTDDQVDELLKLAQERARKADSSLKVIAAADRAEICLPHKEGDNNKRQSEAASRDSAFASTVEICRQHIFVCHDNEQVFECCKKDHPEITIVKTDNAPEWDDVFHSKDIHGKPTMYLTSCDAKYQDCQNGVDLCRKIRKDICTEVPVFLIAKNHSDMKKYKEMAEESNARVTDFITEPFTPAYIRTRIRMGIARNPCRWMQPEIPKNEPQRLDALHSLGLVRDQESRFDAIVQLARTALGVEAAALNLLEEDFQWTKAFSCPLLKGMHPKPESREQSFCSHAILGDDVFVINDTHADYRFADNPQVTGGMKVRFYAGAPLCINCPISGENHNVGTLCMMQRKPRKLNDHEKDMMRQFAALLKRELTLSIDIASKAKNSVDC